MQMHYSPGAGAQGSCYCGACLVVAVVVLLIWQQWEWATMEEARALAGPARWVTLQIDASARCSTGAADWDLCFEISTNGRFSEELCFDPDKCAPQYWRFPLELGGHTLRFEGQTSAAGWLWKLHDGKVYKQPETQPEG